MQVDPKKLLIVSHVIHFEHEGKYYAYGPYAREIDLWADLFPEVRIACPLRREAPPESAEAFSRANIGFFPVAEAGGDNLIAKLKLLFYTPAMLWSLARAMRWADGIHVRCPGNLGLLGALLAPLFSRNLVAKYAGSWPEMPGDELTTKLQRALLRHWFTGPVTVYGEWPGQPAHIIPFFTSLTSDEQMERARRAAAHRQASPEVHVLFTRRLTEAKNVDCLLQAVAAVKREGAVIRATIVGEGPEQPNLAALARQLRIDGVVTFTGGLPFESVVDHLEQANVLVLTSETEGWPKSIAEAMAFGLTCIGSDRGYLKRMLDGRGIAVTPRDVGALSAALLDIAREPDKYFVMRQRAAEWAQQFTMEGLREAIRRLLEQYWSIRLSVNPQTAPAVIDARSAT